MAAPPSIAPAPRTVVKVSVPPRRAPASGVHRKTDLGYALTVEPVAHEPPKAPTVPAVGSVPVTTPAEPEMAVIGGHVGENDGVDEAVLLLVAVVVAVAVGDGDAPVDSVGVGDMGTP